MKFFELVLLADQSLVEARWISEVPGALRAEAVQLLSSAPRGRAPRGDLELQWAFEPGRGLFTVRRAGHVVLLAVLASEAQEPFLDAWLAELRAMPAVQKLHAGDAEAFEIMRRLPHRPLFGAVLLPDASREELREVVEFAAACAAAVFDARW